MLKFLILATLTLQSYGGSRGDSDDATPTSAPAEAPKAEVVLDPNLDKECLERKAQANLAKPTAAYCKTLKDGSVSSVTVQPGDDRVNSETCEISYDGKGLIQALLELGYMECDRDT